MRYVYQIWDACSSEMIGLYSSREKAQEYIDLVTQEDKDFCKRHGFESLGLDWHIEEVPVDDFSEFNEKGNQT